MHSTKVCTKMAAEMAPKCVFLTFEKNLRIEFNHRLPPGKNLCYDCAPVLKILVKLSVLYNCVQAFFEFYYTLEAHIEAAR